MKRINPLTKQMRADIQFELHQALSIHVAIDEGMKQVRSQARKFPDKKIRIKEHISSKARYTTYMGLTNKSVLKLLTNNRFHLTEIFHGRVIQIWFDYLGEIYRCMIQDQLSGKRHWNLPKTQVQLDFSESGSRQFRTALCESLYDAFCFLPSLQKRTIIFKALSSTEYGRKRLATIKAEADVIEKSVSIRNVIQHHRGRVQEHDLRKHGIKNFEIILSENKVLKIKAGQKIYITYKSLENLTDSISKVAGQLRVAWIMSTPGSH